MRDLIASGLALAAFLCSLSACAGGALCQSNDDCQADEACRDGACDRLEAGEGDVYKRQA